MINILSLLILILIAVINIVFGLFLLLRPTSAFEMQKRFYEKINWRITPISIEKEIRNTKIMGIFLIVVTIVMIGCSLIKFA